MFDLFYYSSYSYAGFSSDGDYHCQDCCFCKRHVTVLRLFRAGLFAMSHLMFSWSNPKP